MQNYVDQYVSCCCLVARCTTLPVTAFLRSWLCCWCGTSCSHSSCSLSSCHRLTAAAIFHSGLCCWCGISCSCLFCSLLCCHLFTACGSISPQRTVLLVAPAAPTRFVLFCVVISSLPVAAFLHSGLWCWFGTSCSCSFLSSCLLSSLASVINLVLLIPAYPHMQLLLFVFSLIAADEACPSFHGLATAFL